MIFWALVKIREENILLGIRNNGRRNTLAESFGSRSVNMTVLKESISIFVLKF